MGRGFDFNVLTHRRGRNGGVFVFGDRSVEAEYGASGRRAVGRSRERNQRFCGMSTSGDA
jgi:hypothetical protein